MKNPQNMRRLSIGLAAALMITSSFSGFSGVSGRKTASAKSSKVTITIMTRWAGSDPMVPCFKAEKKAFMKKYPNIVIQDNSISEENSYNNKLKTSIATGDTPSVFYYPGIAGLSTWAKNGVIMNMASIEKKDKSWSSGFISGALAEYDLSGYGIKGIYGVPFCFSPEVFFYNTALFKKAGISSTPKTMNDLYADIKKLKAVNVVPWSCGAKDNWRTGHIFNNIIYKYIGVENVKKLGQRKLKYTDSRVVRALQVLKDLKSKGAFEQGFEGVDYNTETSEFFSGKDAMCVNGSWFVTNINASAVKGKIKFFPCPYFSDKPQYKNNNVLFNQSMSLSNTMGSKEKAAAVKFIEWFTSKSTEEMSLKKGGQLGSRKDLDTSKLGLDSLTSSLVAYMKTIKVPGGDIFDYDPDAAMMDVQRTAIVNMLLGTTAKAAAQTMAKEATQYAKTSK